MARLQVRVENERGGCLQLVQPVEQAVEKCRLARRPVAILSTK
jgi:hypothetical protein